MPGSNPAVQFFAGSPRLQQLVALHVMFEKPGDEAPGRQVLRCRELIFRCPAVLASPDGDGAFTLVVLPRTFNLGQTIADMRAKVLGDRPATCADFASCLRYTLRAKLAPQWNVVGDLLVQGRDFLQVTGPLNAVRLQVNVTEADVCLSAQACVVRLPRLTLSDLGAPPDVIADFQTGASDVITERQLTGRWCHNLPSMKKGQVASVTRYLLPTGPFATYRDLKRHWKNMYGYRLPEEEPSHYLNVNFRLIGPQLFTYPPYCLRSGPAVFLSRPAPRPILTALLRDLHVKVGSVCGHQLTFSGTPSYLTTQLQPAPMVGDRPNLSSVPVTRQPPVVTRQVSLVPSPAPGPTRAQVTAVPSSGRGTASATLQRGVRPRTAPQGPGANPSQASLPPGVSAGTASMRPGANQTAAYDRPRVIPGPSPASGGVSVTSDPSPAGPAAPSPTAHHLAHPPPPQSGAAVTPQRAGTAPSGVPPAVPASPRAGQVPACSASAPGPAGLAASPRPARIVPVFKPRPTAGHSLPKPRSAVTKQALTSSKPAPGLAKPTGSGTKPTGDISKIPGGLSHPTLPRSSTTLPFSKPALSLSKTAGPFSKPAGAVSKPGQAGKRPGGPAGERKAAPTAGRDGQRVGAASGEPRRQDQDIPALYSRGQLQRASVAALAEWLRRRGQRCPGRAVKHQLIAMVETCLGRG